MKLLIIYITRERHYNYYYYKNIEKCKSYHYILPYFHFSYSLVLHVHTFISYYNCNIPSLCSLLFLKYHPANTNLAPLTYHTRMRDYYLNISPLYAEDVILIHSKRSLKALLKNITPYRRSLCHCLEYVLLMLVSACHAMLTHISIYFSHLLISAGI